MKEKGLMVENDITTITMGKKIIRMIILDFSLGDIPIEEYLTVQMNDIFFDIITFPVFFNRMARWKAEMDNLYTLAAFDSKVYEAQQYEELRNFLLGKGDKATETAIEMAIKRTGNYSIKKKAEFEIKRQADIMDGLYWSAKSKDSKLNAISAKVKPEEFDVELISKKYNDVREFNGVRVTFTDNMFENKRKTNY